MTDDWGVAAEVPPGQSCDVSAVSVSGLVAEAAVYVCVLQVEVEAPLVIHTQITQESACRDPYATQQTVSPAT